LIAAHKNNLLAKEIHSRISCFTDDLIIFMERPRLVQAGSLAAGGRRRDLQVSEVAAGGEPIEKG
jgi:hypothetical protein